MIRPGWELKVFGTEGAEKTVRPLNGRRLAAREALRGTRYMPKFNNSPLFMDENGSGTQDIRRGVFRLSRKERRKVVGHMRWQQGVRA